MMREPEKRTAVGAGTSAGDAIEEEEAPESRAAEAEVDEMLESLRTTGAQPTGVEAPTAGQSPAANNDMTSSDVKEAPGSAGRRAALRPEGARADLKQNQAGIASRLERDR